jgi:hypothetical protein
MPGLVPGIHALLCVKHKKRPAVKPAFSSLGIEPYAKQLDPVRSSPGGLGG